MALLGAMILENEVIGDNVVSLVQREMFAYPAHQAIFEAICRLNAEKKPVDLVVLRQELATDRKLETVGGAEYLMSLTDGSPSPANAPAYAQIVVSLFRRRKAMEAMRAASLAVSSGIVDGQVAKVRQALDELEGNVSPSSADAPRPRTLAELRELARELAAEPRIPLGIEALDEALSGGVKARWLIVAGGFSGEGKTSLCVYVAARFSFLGHPALFLTFELAEVEIAAKVDASLQDLNETLPQLRILAPSGDIGSVIRVVEEWAAEQDGAELTPVLVVDYLQKVKGPESSSREREVAVVAEELQSVGRRLGIIVFVAAQLNRASQETIPRLHHLRESGLIEQCADVALLLQKTGPDSIRVHVGKNRWGKAGDEVDLGVDFARSRFGPLSDSQRLRDLADRVVQRLEKRRGKATLRDLSAGIRWGEGHPTTGEILSAASATGRYRVEGTEAIL